MSSTNIDLAFKNLFFAELQFRLALAVKLATDLKTQPLDLPQQWSHGKHTVKYEEIALRQDQAEYAAFLFQNSATHTLAVATKEAIEYVVPNLGKIREKNEKYVLNTIKIQTNKCWKCSDIEVAKTYHISRLIRNAYSHAPFNPKWDIRKPLQNKKFIISNVISFDTTGLNGKDFKWQHYGGPLALFRLCRFAIQQILNKPIKKRKNVPSPKNKIYKHGSSVLKRIDKMPKNIEVTNLADLPGGVLDLGNGYALKHWDKK